MGRQQATAKSRSLRLNGSNAIGRIESAGDAPCPFGVKSFARMRACRLGSVQCSQSASVTCPSVFARRPNPHAPNSDVDRIDNDKPRPMVCHLAKVPRVECQKMRHAMNLANGDESGVMDLSADDAESFDKCFPGGIDARGLHEQRERRLESCGLRLSVRRRLSQAVYSSWPGGDVAKLDQNLCGEMQLSRRGDASRERLGPRRRDSHPPSWPAAPECSYR